MGIFSQKGQIGGSGVKSSLEDLLKALLDGSRQGMLHGTQDFGYGGTPANIIRNKRVATENAIKSAKEVLSELQTYFKLMKAAEEAYSKNDYKKAMEFVEGAIKIYNSLVKKEEDLHGHVRVYGWL